MKASSVVVRSVSKTYRRGLRQITTLEDVAFDLSQGEVVLFVGPSGSGKSTLLNVLGGIEAPTAGSVCLDDTDLTALDDDALTLTTAGFAAA